RHAVGEEEYADLRRLAMREWIARENGPQFRGAPHHHIDLLPHLLGESFLQLRLNLAFGELACKHDVAALDVGANILQAEVRAHRSEVLHRQHSGSADIDRPQECNKYRHDRALAGRMILSEKPTIGRDLPTLDERR